MVKFDSDVSVDFLQPPNDIHVLRDVEQSFVQQLLRTTELLVACCILFLSLAQLGLLLLHRAQGLLSFGEACIKLHAPLGNHCASEPVQHGPGNRGFLTLAVPPQFGLPAPQYQLQVCREVSLKV